MLRTNPQSLRYSSECVAGVLSEVHRGLLTRQSRASRPYYTRSSYSPHFLWCPRSVPSWVIPIFLITLPEAGLLPKCAA